MGNKNINTKVLELILPENTLQWFDIIDATKTDKGMHIVLEEKNNPPLPDNYNNESILSKGFKELTISDFPLRGRKTLLTFRRRRWQIEGQDKLLKREIKLTAEGTLLEKEFADFLKK